MSKRIHDERLIRALRAMNSELAASNRAIAARTGLNDSDLAVLDVLHRDGPQTPTSLARRTPMGTTTMACVPSPFTPQVLIVLPRYSCPPTRS